MRKTRFLVRSFRSFQEIEDFLNLYAMAPDTDVSVEAMTEGEIATEAAAPPLALFTMVIKLVNGATSH